MVTYINDCVFDITLAAQDEEREEIGGLDDGKIGGDLCGELAHISDFG